jgi:hypothetical protein
MTRSALTFAAAAALALGSGGCPLNVNGNAHSGKDKSYKGAGKIVLEDVGGGTLEGKAKGIVTYPGGDRSDWKQFEVPAGKPGDLQITLKYRPPRKGLDLAFDIFDQYGQHKGGVKPSPKKHRTSKEATVPDVDPGIWYVRVYASNRIDAGDYRLTVDLNEKKVMVSQVDLQKLKGEIPDPPTLPAPVPPKQMTPAEKAKCDQDFAKCTADHDKCEADNAANAGKAPKPVQGRVMMPQLDSSGMVIITIDRGTKHGVDRGWDGQIQGAGGNGAFKVISVRESSSVGKVKMSVDQVKANPNVTLTPPAGSSAGPIVCKECPPCPVQ